MRIRVSFLAVGLAMLLNVAVAQAPPAQHKWVIVLHGGAGVIERSSMTPEAEKQLLDRLRSAIDPALQVLPASASPASGDKS